MQLQPGGFPSRATFRMAEWQVGHIVPRDAAAFGDASPRPLPDDEPSDAAELGVTSSGSSATRCRRHRSGGRAIAPGGAENVAFVRLAPVSSTRASRAFRRMPLRVTVQSQPRRRRIRWRLAAEARKRGCGSALSLSMPALSRLAVVSQCMGCERAAVRLAVC